MKKLIKSEYESQLIPAADLEAIWNKVEVPDYQKPNDLASQIQLKLNALIIMNVFNVIAIGCITIFSFSGLSSSFTSIQTSKILNEAAMKNSAGGFVLSKSARYSQKSKKEKNTVAIPISNVGILDGREQGKSISHRDPQLLWTNSFLEAEREGLSRINNYTLSESIRTNYFAGNSLIDSQRVDICFQKDDSLISIQLPSFEYKPKPSEFKINKGVKKSSNINTLRVFEGKFGIYFNFQPNRNGDLLANNYPDARNFSSPFILSKSFNSGIMKSLKVSDKSDLLLKFGYFNSSQIIQKKLYFQEKDTMGFSYISRSVDKTKLMSSGMQIGAGINRRLSNFIYFNTSANLDLQLVSMDIIQTYNSSVQF